MPTTRLDGRAIIDIGGADAGTFLQNLITTDVDGLPARTARAGALLSPQGKILFDFLVSRAGDGLRIDCRSDLAMDLMRRLTLYRLRARVEFSMENPAVVLVSFGDESPGEDWIADSRFSRIAVWRHYGDAGIVVDAGEADWHRLRVMHGVGESGADFAPGDAFPHDVLFDRNGGVSFAKGCYVGQEVVTRMQHRGTARRRLILAEAGEDLPPPGTGIVAGGRAIGTLGSVSGRHGLAMVRIDRAGRAMADGVAILAGETGIRLAIPEWAGFGFPAEAGED